MHNISNKKTKSKLLTSTLMITAMLLAVPVQAQAASTDIAIKAQPMETALNKLAQAYDKQIIVYSADAKDMTVQTIEGTFTEEEALNIILKNSGLVYKYVNERTIAVGSAERLAVKTEQKNAVNTQQAEVPPFRMAQLDKETPRALEANAAPDNDSPVSIDVEPEQLEKYDEVVVTGSRIRRATNAQAAIPLQVLTAADIDASGSVDIAEVLTEIPGVDFSISPDTSQTSVQNNGLSTINLRRMGGNRTLTLIDGLRAVSNSGNGERVSLNTIPAGFVKRVEVTTGGASAIYGSDAIAGVANIILKDDFEGLEVDYRYSQADASGEVENTINVTYGTKFLNDRGYALFGLTYDDETAVFSDETRPKSFATVEWSAPTITSEGAFDDERGFGNCDTSGRFCINPGGRSSFLPGGRFEGGDAWNIDGVWYNDQGLTFPDGRPASEDFVTDVDGYNFRIGRMLSPEQKTLTLGLKTELELQPNVTAFANIFYIDADTTNQSPSQTVSNRTDIGPLNALGDIGSMSSSHPFIPQAVEDTRRGSVSWRRRFNEVGPEIRINDRKTLRSSFGLRGEVWDTWQWEVYGSYGKFNQEQRQLNEVNFLNVRYALDIQDDGNGGYECVDADARADGCVPLNIFGTGTISEAAADYVRYNPLVTQERTQQVWAASMNGDIFDAPAGPIKAAFGIEHRKEDQDTVGDPDNVAELTSVAHVTNLKAGISVTEIFTELDIPIIEDKLSLQVAARGADYSHIGSVVSYNIGGSWQPVNSLRFRGQFSRSQRAPTIIETFSDLRADNDTARDPCDNLESDGSGVTSPVGSDTDLSAIVSANCLAEPGIQAFFADPDNAGDAFEVGTSIFAPNGGNLNLKEETASTYTFGAIFTPSFIENLTLIADYYKISLDDAIGAVDTQTVLDLCYTDPTFNNNFCDVISRDASSGRINEVQNILENLDNITREGIDITVDYEWEFPGVPGDFGFNIRGSHYLKDETTFQSVNGPALDSELGEISKPENEFRARFNWQHNGLRLVYTAKYRDGGVDNINVLPEDNEYFRVGSQTYHDLFARYTFRKNPRIRLYGGIRNLLNDHGPLVPTGLDHGSLRNIISEINNPIGREFYGGIRVRW